MTKFGRPRNTSPGDPILPPGVRKVGERYYWQPTNKQEREARRTAGLPLSVALGKDLTAMRKEWGKLQRPELPPEAGTLAEILYRWRDEELPRIKKQSGKPKYSANTRTAYEAAFGVFMLAFGTREYAKNEVEASRGAKLRALDLQRWLNEQEHGPQANRHLAALSSAFACARRWGYTEHNPCLGVERAEEEPRQRDVEPWEIEVLLTACEVQANGQRGYMPNWNMALMIRLADITGASGQDIRDLRREHLKAGGLAITRGKTGTRRIAEWTPELRAIIDAALDMGPPLRGAVFCNRKGLPYSESGFQSQWRRLLGKARALALEAGLPPLDNLHFHDIRKKAGNDAEEQGQSMSDFLGNDPATARGHYKLRPTKVKPTK